MTDRVRVLTFYRKLAAYYGTKLPFIPEGDYQDWEAAISIPFGTLPLNRYITGPRYRVMFDRIVTPRFCKDIDELQTWDMDVERIMDEVVAQSNAARDIHAKVQARRAA